MLQAGKALLSWSKTLGAGYNSLDLMRNVLKKLSQYGQESCCAKGLMQTGCHWYGGGTFGDGTG